MFVFNRFLAVALVSILAVPAFAETTHDAAGREVTLPDDVTRVYAAGPPADVLLYVLKPQSMLGWVRPVPDDGKTLVLPETRDLPSLGRLTGKGDTLNLERLLEADAQMVLDYGNINATYVDLAKRVEAQTGLPYLLLDGAFAKTSETLRSLGNVLGVPDRGEALAKEAERIVESVDAMVAKVPADRRPKVYLARGPEGLESASRGSIHSEIIERAGGINVATGDGKGLITVSPEQLHAWAPDIIITVDADFAKNAIDMPELKGIPAVDNRRIYLAPQRPFGFIDAPPSVNRLLGLRWLAAKLHPEIAGEGLGDDVRAFYHLFYQVDLSDADLKALIGA